MLTASSERAAKAQSYVEQWLAVAKQSSGRAHGSDYLRERKLLESLIPINAAGFRGVVITAFVGKMLNPSFDPTIDFYACNPRSIFEKGIYYALVENGVPCGKSDPLNVAKNVQRMDANWAKGRRPESAALAAVEYIQLIHDNWMNLAYRDTLIQLFFERLWAFALYCKSKNQPLAEFVGATSAELAVKLASFVASYPEGGATPQIVVGTLIRVLRLDDPNVDSVQGVDESVFGTNTTSKKPADVWEVLTDGSLGSLYEITAKPVDIKRLDDCVSTLKGQGIEGRVVTFICRIAEDIKSIPVKDRCLTHGGMAFQFIDIREFIIIVFCLLKEEQQSAVIKIVDGYVKETNRKTTTKEGWGELFGYTA